MRSKAPLALMEQAVMVLVFALAAVLCLRVFVWSDRTSGTGKAYDMAVIHVESLAETIKHEGQNGSEAGEAMSAAAKRLGADFNEKDCELNAGYDGEWSSTDVEGCKYILTANRADTEVRGLEQVHIKAVDVDSGSVLFEIDVAWQKEA